MQNPRSPIHKIRPISRKEDNNKTIYPTPVFEEVLSRLDSQNVAGEPPVTQDGF
jgi:hypothetical protein